MTHYALESMYESYIQPLSLAERLQLVELIVRRAIPLTATPPRPRQWSELRGAAPYPMLGEDAQQWVSRSRQEDQHETV